MSALTALFRCVEVKHDAQNDPKRMNNVEYHNLVTVRIRCKKALLRVLLGAPSSHRMKKVFYNDTFASLLSPIEKRPCFASTSVWREYPYVKDEEQHDVPNHSGDFETAVDSGLRSYNALVTPVETALSERWFWSRSLRLTVTFVHKWQASAARRYTW